MPGSQLTRTIFQLIEAEVASLGVDLVDVERVSQHKGGPKTLCLIIDKRGGVNTEDCSAVSRLVDPMIDSRPDIGGHDFLEVSSPGLNRPLKTTRDLARHLGEQVEVKLYRASNGRKTYLGHLAPCTDEIVALDMEDGNQLIFTRNMVAKIQRTVQF